MEKILERDFKNGMLELIDKHIGLYNDAIIHSIFYGEPMEVSALVGGSYALRKLREAVENEEYQKDYDVDLELLRELLK